MKYEPKMVFVIEDGGYKGLTYQEYCARCIDEYSGLRDTSVRGFGNRHSGN